MKSLRETLKQAEPSVGIPGMATDYEAWPDDVKALAESVWPSIAERVLQEYATQLHVDAYGASPIEQRLYLSLQAHYIDAFMNYPHDTALLVRQEVSQISALLESKGEPGLNSDDEFWDYEIDMFLYLDFRLVDVAGKLHRCPPFYVAIECDGWAYHGDKDSFQRDHTKTLDLQVQGLDIIRFTGADINRDVAACVRRIDRLAEVHAAKVKRCLERCA